MFAGVAMSVMLLLQRKLRAAAQFARGHLQMCIQLRTDTFRSRFVRMHIRVRVCMHLWMQPSSVTGARVCVVMNESNIYMYMYVYTNQLECNTNLWRVVERHYPPKYIKKMYIYVCTCMHVCIHQYIFKYIYTCI